MSASVAIALCVGALCLLSLGLRVHVRYGPPGYLFYGHAQTARPRADAFTWALHAIHLLEGRGFGDSIKQFSERNYIPPGHPAVLGAWMSLVGKNPVHIGWVVALACSLLPWLAYLWGREMWGRRIGLWTALLAALHPPYIHIGFSLMSEPTAILGSAIAMVFGARALRRGRQVDAVVAGLAFGAAALIRPTALAFFWGVLAAMFFLRSIPLQQRCRLALIGFLCALIPLGAWQYRNYRVHGVPSAVYSSISARHAWQGAHPRYRPVFYSRSGWHETLWRDPEATEMERIHRLQQEARAFVREDRLRYVMSCVWRMRALFPEFQHRAPTIRPTQGGWGRLQFMVLLPLALIGVGLGWRTAASLRIGDRVQRISGRVWTLSLGIGLGVAVVGAGMYGAADRYRWPLEYFLFPFAALTLDALSRIRSRPLGASHTLQDERAMAGPVLRRWKRIGLGTVLILSAVYCGRIVYRQWHPVVPEERAPRLALSHVETWVAETGLAEEWETQATRWITYDDVFAEQARHDGALVALNGKLVAWWGILRFPESDDGGFREGYIMLEPQPGDFGRVRLLIRRHPDAARLDGDWRDGSIIAILGRLHYRQRPLARPIVAVYAMRPGRVSL